MLNVNRNINLATPLVRKGGKGPDVLPYLTNLKMFVYYSDLASNTILTGKPTASGFISESRWIPYYQYATISASVSGTLFNTLTAASQANYSIVSRSVGEGPYFTGSLADPPNISQNQNPNSQYQVYISGSSALSDISSSWTYVTYIKPDPTSQNIYNYALYAQNLYNYFENKPPQNIPALKAAAIDLFNSKIIVSTGQFFGGIPNRIYSGSFDIPGTINMLDGNYHMVTITVNNSTASVYVDTELTSGSGTTQLLEYGWNVLNSSETTFRDMKFGSNVNTSFLGAGVQIYRAFNGSNKSIAIWDKSFTAADVVGMYGIFLRDNLAPGINVDV
jgi:hypothetical protein